jgi:hypothetical protein
MTGIRQSTEIRFSPYFSEHGSASEGKGFKQWEFIVGDTSQSNDFPVNDTFFLSLFQSRQRESRAIAGFRYTVKDRTEEDIIHHLFPYGYLFEGMARATYRTFMMYRKERMALVKMYPLQMKLLTEFEMLVQDELVVILLRYQLKELAALTLIPVRLPDMDTGYSIIQQPAESRCFSRQSAGRSNNDNFHLRNASFSESCDDLIRNLFPGHEHTPENRSHTRSTGHR